MKPATIRVVRRSALLLTAALTGLICGQSPAAPLDPGSLAPEAPSGFRVGLQTRYAPNSMAAAANPLAAMAGQAMLQRGGSAADSAIAMQMVLALVEPQSSGIAGGAVILYWDGSKVQSYDGRETAPQAADENLFLDAQGRPLPFRRAQIGGRSVGTPGVLRALELMHREHGKLPWADLFAPAIHLAEEGFVISPRLASLIADDPQLHGDADAAAYFFMPDGRPKPAGTLLKNPAFAATLKAIAAGGADAFYRGDIATDIVAKVNGHANPGKLAVEDLQNYRAREREPVCSHYRQWRVCGMPPPSSGGIAVAQVLGMLEAYDRNHPRKTLATLAPQAGVPVYRLNAEAVHRIAEAERLAFADRNLYVADPDFLDVNVSGLLDRDYLAQRAALIGERSVGHALPGTPPGTHVSLASDPSPPRISTSQVSAVDAGGGAVSMTTTIESAFGSHLMTHGFLLNNQLTDFSFVPSENGRPVANRVQPGKRPRSSMAPTLVFDRHGQLLAVLGSPGGARIIEFVTKVLVATLDWKMDVQKALDLPNFGSMNGPTEVESDLVDTGLQEALRQRGHQVYATPLTSGVQAILRVRNAGGQRVWAGGADPRREGLAAGD